MGKKVFRYYFDFPDKQENWLNSMAARGYRLKKCGRIAYVFDTCASDEYEYAVEFVGGMSYSKAQDYRGYLESMGFRTFRKNINLNFSYGKVRWRPYAKDTGQIAASPGGFNKELLILEKKKDGKPFELHTDILDKLNVYKEVQRGYAWAVLMVAALGVMTFLPNVSTASLPALWAIRAALLLLAILFIVPTAKYARMVNRLKEERKLYE